jgi:hypothetical protein
MDEVHHTEVDGLEATWRPTHNKTLGIEIMKVHNASGDTGSEVMFAPGTDLVAARQVLPAWDRLWDKVRDEFWGLWCAPRSSVSSSGAWRWD